MAQQQYLDKFKDVISKRQSEQILKLLNKKRNQGEIRTVQEFTTKLEGLMRELTSTVLKPSLSLFMAEENALIDSDTYNEMLDRVEDDLTAAFEEATNIDEVQRSHEALVRDVILKNIRAGVAELESQIDLYEFINRDSNGFDSAIFSTFRESKEERTSRGSLATQILFTDPREGTLFPVNQDASIELIGERLVLAKNSGTFYTITNVRQIFDSESPQSELIVQPPGTKLSNIIDNTAGTYWIQTLLFREKKPFVKTKIEFDLGAIKEVNLVEIEPVTRQGLILEAIHYLDGNNIIVDLGIPETPITGPGSILFKKIAARKIILTFRNINFIPQQFKYTLGKESILNQAISEPVQGFVPTKLGVANTLSSSLPSQKIKDTIGVKSDQQSNFIGYDFTIGLDNIRIGVNSYRSKAIYVSTPLTMSNIGQLGLRIIESRPYLTKSTQQVNYTNTTYDLHKTSELPDDSALVIGQQSNTYFLGSLEYWVIKQDLNQAGGLVRTTVFPILPLNTERIYHERLIFTEKSNGSLAHNDFSKLIFFTNRTNGDIKVYRNGFLLADETGNSSAVTGWQMDPNPNTAGSTPNSGSRMSFRIKILDRFPNDIYTVSYTPMVSSTNSVPSILSIYNDVGGLKIVDLAGDLSVRILPAHIVGLDKTGEKVELAQSMIYLAVILRQNTAEATLTPALEEYTLLSASEDLAKFEQL